MKILTVTSSFLILVYASYGQETVFQNLDFEQAQPVSAGANMVTEASALPGWTVYCGTEVQTAVYENVYALNQATADIFGPSYPVAGPTSGGLPGRIDGNYTAVIQPGVQSINPLTFVSTSLEQTGTIPVGDDSLVFKAWGAGADSFSVSFAGNNLSLIDLGSGPNYTLYGADISSYAGQTGLLDFTANVQAAPSLLALDDIAFSTTAAPEPNSLVLTGIGGLVFASYRRFAPKRS